ncbi:MAG: 2Fe-2S iron-sulfur cluster-binding protein [Pseudomonadota bacterium]
MPRITFINPDGSQIEADGKIGESVMEVATRSGVDIEAACEGSLACATCHLVADQAWHEKVGAPSDDEEDMLDMAFNVTDGSRLSCQIEVTEGLDGLVMHVPEA